MFSIKKWNSVVWALPNGSGLRTAEVCLNPRRFARFLVKHDLAPASADSAPPGPELVRYVPENRALFRHESRHSWERPALYIKVYRSGRDRVPAHNLALIGRATEGGTAGFRPPRILLHDHRRSLVIMEEVPGRQLTTMISIHHSTPAFGAQRAVDSPGTCSQAGLREHPWTSTYCEFSSRYPR